MSGLLGFAFNGALVSIFVIAFSMGLKKREAQYFDGLKGALAAYVIEGLLLLIVAPLRGYSLFLAPPIEEATRVWFARRPATFRASSGTWLIFAFGYALFEATLKIVTIAFANAGSPTLLRSVAVPMVPFVMHLFLSVLMCFLLRRGWAPWQAWLATTVVHLAHNWSVGFMDWGDLWPRMLLFAVLLWVVMWRARSTDPVTSPRPHANTPA